ncbi:MAG: hypothetical protein RH860_07970 [Cytophagales bacterium]
MSWLYLIIIALSFAFVAALTVVAKLRADVRFLGKNLKSEKSAKKDLESAYLNLYIKYEGDCERMKKALHRMGADMAAIRLMNHLQSGLSEQEAAAMKKDMTLQIDETISGIRKLRTGLNATIIAEGKSRKEEKIIEL